METRSLKTTARTPSQPRGNGRRMILDEIRTSGPIARIDIADRTGVSPATVTATTAELLAAGLIEEISPASKERENTRGRPRVALRIRGAAHHVAGIKHSEHHTTVCILDFAGKVIASHEASAPAPRLAAPAMAHHLSGAIAAACAAAGLSRERLSAVGLGIAGIVDAPRGFVYWSPTLSERNVDLRSELEAQLSLPVFIDNDANLVAKAEQLFGQGRGVRDFIVVTIENGVGMGIVIDNRLYRGTRGCGAEFGHTKVHLDGALCRCGQRGCLEAYVADYALLREAEVHEPARPGEDPAGRLNRLFAAAKAGDPMALSIFRRAGRMFAMGLANLVNIFDPELIILSGERMQFDFLYAEEVLAAVRSQVVQIDAPLPEVRIHKWGDLMWARGAAAFAMEGVGEIAIRRIAEDAA